MRCNRTAGCMSVSAKSRARSGCSARAMSDVRSRSRWRRCRSPSPGSTCGRGRSETFPTNVTAVTRGDPVDLLARAPDGAFIAVMTHSHALDLDLVIAALQSRRFAYVGLIGSATKRARFTVGDAQDGHGGGRGRQARLPIGLTAIRDKAPAAIATSVAAQVLIVRAITVYCSSQIQQITSGQVRHG